MKNLKITFLAIVAIITFSCSDDNNNTNGGSDDTFIKFKVDGDQFNIIEPSTITSGATVVMAINMDGQYIMLRMPTDAAVGTHTITESNSVDPSSYSADVAIDGDNVISSTTGTLTIDSMGAEYMEGTFSFTGDLNGTAYAITDGEFRAYKPANNN